MKRALAFLFITFFLVACGIFDKSKKVDKANVKKEKIEIKQEQKSVQIEQSDRNVEMTELVIRIPADKDKLDLSERQEYKSLQEEILAAIRRSEEVAIRTVKEKEETVSVLDSTKSFNNVVDRVDSSSVRRDIDKKSDTTMGANFNSWVILGIAAMIIFAVFMYFRTKRI